LVLEVRQIVRIPEPRELLDGIRLRNFLALHRLFHSLKRRFSLSVIVRAVTG
jgi:hypothetical protein